MRDSAAAMRPSAWSAPQCCDAERGQRAEYRAVWLPQHKQPLATAASLSGASPPLHTPPHPHSATSNLPMAGSHAGRPGVDGLLNTLLQAVDVLQRANHHVKRRREAQRCRTRGSGCHRSLLSGGSPAASAGWRTPAGRAQRWAERNICVPTRAKGSALLWNYSGRQHSRLGVLRTWFAMADDVVTLAIATAAAILSGSPHEDALIRELAASASDRPDAHACLKRLERTVGKHYCALWSQVRRIGAGLGASVIHWLRLRLPVATNLRLRSPPVPDASRSAAAAASTRTGSTHGARRPTAGCLSLRPPWRAPAISP